MTWRVHTVERCWCWRWYPVPIVPGWLGTWHSDSSELNICSSHTCVRWASLDSPLHPATVEIAYVPISSLYSWLLGNLEQIKVHMKQWELVFQYWFFSACCCRSRAIGNEIRSRTNKDGLIQNVFLFSPFFPLCSLTSVLLLGIYHFCFYFPLAIYFFPETVINLPLCLLTSIFVT